MLTIGPLRPALAAAALLAAASPARADFTLSYSSGTYAYGDSGKVGDSVVGSLTFFGAPQMNHAYTAADLASWSLSTNGNAGFSLSSGVGNVLAAFGFVLDGSGNVAYYNFAAEQHAETCAIWCDPGQKLIDVTMNGGQLDAAVIQDPNAYSGADAAYYEPGHWSSASTVDEPLTDAMFIGGLTLLIARRTLRLHATPKSATPR